MNQLLVSYIDGGIGGSPAQADCCNPGIAIKELPSRQTLLRLTVAIQQTQGNLRHESALGDALHKGGAEVMVLHEEGTL